MSKLWFGDCLELMSNIADGSIDMVLADPPYGMTQCKWDSIIPLDIMWEQLKRVTKPNAAIVLMAAQPFTTKLISSNMEMFKYCWVWEKNYSTGFLNAWRRPLVNTEDLCVFYQKSCMYKPVLVDKAQANNWQKNKKDKGSSCYGKFKPGVHRCPKDKTMPKTIIKFNCNRNGRHPTEKPISLMEYMIKTYTNKGETVLDFCMGSGTTGVAAQNLGRKFIGIEKDKTYFDISVSRIENSKTLFPVAL